MSLCDVSATDVLVLVTAEDIYAHDWLPFALNTWAEVQHFNVVADQLALPSPPITPSVFVEQPPPSYQQVMAETVVAAAAAAPAAVDIELISSDDDDEDGDDDVFIEM